MQELDDYAPEPEVHKYLHSRLMHFDVPTLYEMHYNSITLGKVSALPAVTRSRALQSSWLCSFNGWIGDHTPSLFV